ncbi:MAG: PilN domain-containing protein [Paenibacillaceae bacterium]|nr:PilN domain-containing protein [Paenibacillaceae bacterium]
MRAINLLPRIPFVQKWLIPLLALIVMATVGGILLLSYAYFHANSAGERSQNQIQSLQTDISKLRQAQQIDAKTQAYNQLQMDITKLQDQRRDWLPIIGAITGNMPTATRLNDFAVADNKISLKLQSESVKELASYMTLLDKSGLFQAVAVQSIQLAKVGGTVAGSPSPAGATPFVPDTVRGEPSSFVDNGNTGAWEQPVATSTPATKPTSGESEAEHLLRQLDDLLNGRAGGATPTPSPTPNRAGGIGTSGQSAITEEEWQEAKKKYEAQQQATPSPAATPTSKPITSSPSTPATVPVTPLPETNIGKSEQSATPVIQVQLQLTLRSLTPNKQGASR